MPRPQFKPATPEVKGEHSYSYTTEPPPPPYIIEKQLLHQQ